MIGAKSLRARRADRDQESIPPEIWVLVSSAFVIALGYGLIAPILPQYARSFDVSVFAASFVISAFAIFRLVFAPTAGWMVNRAGHRRTYLTGLAIVAVSTFLVGVVQDYWQLLAIRALGGIGSTMFTVSAMGLVVLIAPPEIRGRASSTYGSAFLLGNVIGPLLGALLAPLGMRLPFVIYGTAVFIALLIVWRRLSPAALAQKAPAPTGTVMTFREGLHDSAYRAAVVSAFANGWTNFGVRMAIIPLFAVVLAPGGTSVAGFALTAYAVGNILALQFAGSMSDSHGRRPMAIAGLGVSAAFMILMGFSPNEWWFYLASAGAGAGAGILNPAQQATLADVIGAERQGGKVLADYQMSMDLGVIVGPLIVGVIVDAFGYQTGFIVCGIISLAAAAVWWRGRESAPVCQPEPLDLQRTA